MVHVATALYSISTIGGDTSPRSRVSDDHALADRLSLLAATGHLPRTLRDVGASKDELPALAKEAAEQWTGRFNPRPFDTAGALEIYECAY